jgi:hypothetical protein
MSQRGSTGMERNKSWPVRWKSGHTCSSLAACRLSIGDEIRLAPAPVKANTALLGEPLSRSSVVFSTKCSTTQAVSGISLAHMCVTCIHMLSAR